MTTVRRAALVVLLSAAPALTACDGLLDVDTTGILTPDDLEKAGVASVTPMIFGVVGNYQEALDGIVRYTSLVTDEMIAAGSFEGRFQVDARFIQPDNVELTNAVYVPLHMARYLADTTSLILQERLDDPEYAEVETLLVQGVALSELYAGYTRVWLAELYCWSILEGLYPEPAPLLPDERMREALQVLRGAELAALFAGLPREQAAAVVGQARAHLWLGEYDEAAAAAARVPRGFTYEAEYSQNSTQQYNEVYTATWGDTDPIGWTVGAGVGNRGGEVWEHLEQFIALNLIAPTPFGRFAQNPSIPVMLQLIYPRQDSEIVFASGIEARLIQAEVAVRQGRTPDAEALLNDLRVDFSGRVAIRAKVPLPVEEDLLQPLSLTGDVAADLKTVADERARELWLTGDRMTTGRRLRRDEHGIDLFPPVKVPLSGGDDTAFPIAQRELDANPNLNPSMACPAGQSIGSWR